jgi:L-alanine-DL-glutamate epimerase-like enolase superfamily enzyme
MLGFTWFEEPMIAEDVEGYQRLRAALPIRLAAGESEHTVWGCRALIANGAVGGIQPDVDRSGGVTETRRIGHFAYAHGVPFAPHVGFCGAVCNAASLHLAAALPNFLTFEAMIFDNPLRQQIGRGRPLSAASPSEWGFTHPSRPWSRHRHRSEYVGALSCSVTVPKARALGALAEHTLDLRNIQRAP